MARSLDFDAARAERRREPFKLRVAGVWYELAGRLPASVVLDIIRLQTGEGANFVIPYAELNGFGRRLYGEETWGRILDEAGLDIDDLGDLIMRTVAALQAQDDGPPNRGTRRASRRRASAGSKTGR